ncbi:type II secretion system protein [Lacipirellula sp.]|uniref:type II secretion system protein n=1 Tax=Lacipirellula sp. TaxID=2691419 RepID=UPI003D13643B
MRRRQAMTLIELLAVISACSVVLGVAASLLLTTMRSVNDTQRFFTGERNALRLARQFRADVHQADATTIELAAEEGGETLRLQFPDGQTVAYRQAKDRILRLASLPDDRTAREEFILGDALHVEFKQLDDPSRWALHATANPLPTATDARSTPVNVRETPLRLAIEAIPGRDDRYATAATEESP